MPTHRIDVLVIGSGFGAAGPALRLAEAGLDVVVVEKGPRVDTPDFRQTQDPAYITRFIKGLSGDELNFTFAEALGGGSGFYEMVSLRAPSLAFEQRDQSGKPLWPEGMDRESFDSWYALSEQMLGVEQIKPEEVPRSGLVFALMMKQLGYSCDRAAYAVRNCLGSGFCLTGCIYGAKQSLHKNYLPRAVEAGARYECELEAEEIRPMGNPWPSASATDWERLPYRYEVTCRGVGTRRGIEIFQAKLVVLAGGTVGTALLLLRNQRQLPSLSAATGRHIAINGGVKVCGLLADDLPDGDMFTGRSHPGMISYQFLESHGITVSAVKALPIQALASARLRLDGEPREGWWGEQHVELMGQFRRRMVILLSLGLTPPCGAIQVDPEGKATVVLHRSAELDGYYARVSPLLEDILERNGCKQVHAEWVGSDGGARSGSWHSTAHHTGSARMADHPSRGVVNRMGEVFGYPGLYVADGAAIPSSLAVNTSLTILANAERIAAGILRRYGLKRDRLIADLAGVGVGLM